MTTDTTQRFVALVTPRSTIKIRRTGRIIQTGLCPKCRDHASSLDRYCARCGTRLIWPFIPSNVEEAV